MDYDTKREVVTLSKMACTCAGAGVYVFCSLVALVMVAGAGVVHMIGWYPQAIEWGIFTKTENQTWQWDAQLGPSRLVRPDWLFYMWAIAYAVQLVWILYGLELVCRKSQYRLSVLPSGVYLLMMFSAAATVAWLGLWTRGDLHVYAPLCLLGACYFVYLTMFISIMALNKAEPLLGGARSLNLLWENQILVHNCQGLFAGWVTVVLFYNVAYLVASNALLDSGHETYIFLSVLAVYIFVWFALDMGIGRLRSPYLITPYLVWIVAILQVVLQTTPFDYYFIYSVVLLAITIILGLIRMAIGIGGARSKTMIQ